MLIEEIRSSFRDWTDEAALAEAGIRFQESFAPSNDPLDDYALVYTAEFEPNAPDKARIELALTDTGHVAVGVETYARIAQRLGRRFARGGFVVGHEPRTVPAEGLKMLFGLVTRGQIFLEIYNILYIWNAARMYAPPADCSAMIESGYRCPTWISSLPSGATRPAESLFGTILSYKPWR